MNDPSKSAPNEPEGGELGPEALALIGRARRSFAISMGILLLGFMAIAFALVYRATRDAPPEAIVAEIAVPAGAEILSAVRAEGRINVTYRLAGRTVLGLFALDSGELIGEIAIGGE